MNDIYNRFDVKLIEWDKSFEREIAEVYRILKDQENKIFDLSWKEENPNGIMEYAESMIRNEAVFVIVDTELNNIAGVFMVEKIRMYKGRGLYGFLHCIIPKKYWGKTSRDICEVFKTYLQVNCPINRLLVEVPQNAYSVIKLLKNMGFRHEGTIKKIMVYLDKNGNEKLYDSMVYGLDLEEI